MVTWVETSWVQDRLEDSSILVIDPRRPMKYMQGHLLGAVNLPTYTAFDNSGALLKPDELARWIGTSGLQNGQTPVLYDSYDGQNSSMLAWILEYLGVTNVHIMHRFFERWEKDGRDVYYKPVKRSPSPFESHPNENVRAQWEHAIDSDGNVKIDFRSAKEYTGEVNGEDDGGHIPDAINLEWKSLLGNDGAFLAPEESLQAWLKEAIPNSDKKIIAYCRSGLRASVGYLALSTIGYDVSLYDGSMNDWVNRGLPVVKS